MGPSWPLLVLIAGGTCQFVSAIPAGHAVRHQYTLLLPGAFPPVKRQRCYNLYGPSSFCYTCSDLPFDPVWGLYISRAHMSDQDNPYIKGLGPNKGPRVMAEDGRGAGTSQGRVRGPTISPGL